MGQNKSKGVRLWEKKERNRNVTEEDVGKRKKKESAQLKND